MASFLCLYWPWCHFSLCYMQFAVFKEVPAQHHTPARSVDPIFLSLKDKHAFACDIEAYLFLVTLLCTQYQRYLESINRAIMRKRNWEGKGKAIWACIIFVQILALLLYKRIFSQVENPIICKMNSAHCKTNTVAHCFFFKRQKRTTFGTADTAGTAKYYLLPTRSSCGRCRNQCVWQCSLWKEMETGRAGPNPRCNLIYCFAWITHALEAWHQFLTVKDKYNHCWNSSMHTENQLIYAFGKLVQKEMSS